MCRSVLASIGLVVFIPPTCKKAGLHVRCLGGSPCLGPWPRGLRAPLSILLLDRRKPLGDDACLVERHLPVFATSCRSQDLKACNPQARHPGSSPSPAVCPTDCSVTRCGGSTHTYPKGQHRVRAHSRSQPPLSSQGSCWVCGPCQASATPRTPSCQVCTTQCPAHPASHQPCQKKVPQEPSTFCPSRARVGITSCGTTTRSGTATYS